MTNEYNMPVRMDAYTMRDVLTAIKRSGGQIATIAEDPMDLPPHAWSDDQVVWLMSKMWTLRASASGMPIWERCATPEAAAVIHKCAISLLTRSGMQVTPAAEGVPTVMIPYMIVSEAIEALGTEKDIDALRLIITAVAQHGYTKKYGVEPKPHCLSAWSPANVTWLLYHLRDAQQSISNIDLLKRDDDNEIRNVIRHRITESMMTYPCPTDIDLIDDMSSIQDDVTDNGVGFDIAVLQLDDEDEYDIPRNPNAARWGGGTGLWALKQLEKSGMTIGTFARMWRIRESDLRQAMAEGFHPESPRRAILLGG